jgi:hypothetical protein
VDARCVEEQFAATRTFTIHIRGIINNEQLNKMLNTGMKNTEGVMLLATEGNAKSGLFEWVASYF